MSRMVKKAILFTDIKSSSVLWKTYKVSEVVSVLDKHDERVRKCAETYHGTIIKTSGDSYMIAFDKWQDAFKFCISFQHYEHHQPLHVGKDVLRIRIGFCYGRVLEKRILLQGQWMVDYFGTMVNKASRLESGVSDVGHFAFGFDESPSKPPSLPKCDIDYSYTIEEYSNHCDQVSRSQRLLNTLQHHGHMSGFGCHAEGTLKGVGEVTAYKIVIHF